MNKRIVILEGPDRIRKRPAVIFGSDDAEGTFEVLITMINILAREAILGYCRKISVIIHKDNSVSIHSCDRGMILDETVIDSKPRWQIDFCDFGVNSYHSNELYFDNLSNNQDFLYGSGDEEPEYPFDLDYRFSLCCVQCVSEYMIVDSIRDGIRKIVEFNKGYPSSKIKKTLCNEPSSTTIKFKTDSDVFSDTSISFEALSRYLQVLTITIRGLNCNLHSEYNNKTISYQYDDGISEYICSKYSYIKEKEAIGRDRYNKREYKARVRIAVCFAKGMVRKECFHNYRELEHGGLHLNAVKNKIRDFLMWHELFDGFNEQEYSELVEILLNNLTIIIETNCSANSTMWANGEQKAISNKMIADIAEDLINEDFRYYLKQNKARVLSIIQNNEF